MLITQLLQFIFGVAILIIIHEIGHFVSSRLLGVEIEEFGIGFPPRIMKLFEAGGTTYTLNLIPLGGFVRAKGESDPGVKGGYADASPWVRLAISISGPIMNLIVGVMLASLLFYTIGEPVLDQVKIHAVVTNSPADEVGLESGDLVISVNGEKVSGIPHLQEMIRQNLGTPISFEFQRGDLIQSTTVTPRLNASPQEGAIGIQLVNPSQPTTVWRAIKTGISTSYDYARSILLLPIRLIQGDAAPQEGRLLGYKGMFDLYQRLRSPILFFMAISLSLGLINLFPIPALDGGRILLIIPELLFKKRIPPDKENLIHLIGFMILMVLFIIINIQDFLNPVQFPQ